ncbi:MAG: phosphoserine phosphatase SerB, partial [Actinomycetes bacterium]
LKQVADVTERAMLGELDFAESLRARVAKLADLPESAIKKALERIRVTEGAELLIAAVQRAGGRVGAVSGGFNQLLDPLAKRLNLDYHRANQLEILNGKLTGRVTGAIIDRAAKEFALREWAEDFGISMDHTVAIGDGANDLSMIKAAGFGVAFNAKPIVRENADYILEGGNLNALIEVLER